MLSRRFLSWSLPILLALGIGAWLRPRSLDLLARSPARWSFGDAASGGNSLAWTDSGSPWRFGMRLRPGFAYPYAAAGLHLGAGGTVLDLNGYDSLVLEARSRRQRSLRLVVQSVEPGKTDTNRSLTFVPLEAAVPVEPGWSRQALAVRDLTIPLWWTQQRGEAPRSLPAVRARAARLFLENGMGTPVGPEDTIEVRSLRLEGGSWWPMAAALLAGLTVSSLLGLAARGRRGAPLPEEAGRQDAAMLPVVRDVPLEPRRDEELRRLLGWVGERYADPDLGVEQAARAVGIPTRRIPGLLRSAGHGSFPAFVNSLRVGQAQRLLRETDRTVSEIAVAVGVPNVPHFHRLFKAAAGRTPLEWRNEGRAGLSGEPAASDPGA